MTALGQVGERAAAELRRRVEELASAVEDDASDFMEVARLADAVGETADRIGGMYSELEQTLMQGLQQRAADAEPRREEGPSHAGASETEDATKEELLEQARDLGVQGRSSMSKEELGQAVAAEESLTKEELLERARDAGIEGRSSMTKDELREALNAART